MYEGDLPFVRQKEDLVIAADGGYGYLTAVGMQPDVLIGDFDSMKKPEAACEIIALPVEKDDTDSVFAVKEGFRRGYREFVLLGGLGGSRLSHTLANIQLLAYIKEQGGNGLLVGGKTTLFLLQNESRTFPAGGKGSCSVFAYSEKAAVTLDGLYYPLKRGEITNRFPLGVSNRFTGRQAAITVHEGTVLVIVEE